MPATSVRFHPGVEPHLVPIAQVHQFPGNPRNGDTEAIAESILVNGMYQPVVAQRSSGNILAGNHRYAALLSLGEDRIPVVWVDVDDTEAARIALVDNRSSDLAWYDDSALLALLETLGKDETALFGSGYSPGDLDDLVLSLSRAEVKSLDDLHDMLGDPTDQDGWVTVAFKVPQLLAASWQDHLGAHGGNHVAALTVLLESR